jgi:hypothetical protein
LPVRVAMTTSTDPPRGRVPHSPQAAAKAQPPSGDKGTIEA